LQLDRSDFVSKTFDFRGVAMVVNNSEPSSNEASVGVTVILQDACDNYILLDR
jgi:hypothetical protein